MRDGSRRRSPCPQAIDAGARDGTRENRPIRALQKDPKNEGGGIACGKQGPETFQKETAQPQERTLVAFKRGTRREHRESQGRGLSRKLGRLKVGKHPLLIILNDRVFHDLIIRCRAEKSAETRRTIRWFAQSTKKNRTRGMLLALEIEKRYPVRTAPKR